jgi:ADP-ribose pyrophosphatase YjhB (NUDIX family)
MGYLATLRDKDIFPFRENQPRESYEKRVTVKAIVTNDKGELCFIANAVHGFYFLAGGGAEGDDLQEEIKRECIEEIQYEIEVVREIGRIHEFRDREAKEYETVCFFVKTKKKISEDLRTEDEKKNNLSSIWMNLDVAQKILEEQVIKVKTGKVNFYNIAFNIVRDQLFLQSFLGKKEV